MSLQNPPCSHTLHSFTQMNICTLNTHSFTYFQFLYTKMKLDHLAINEQTFVTLHCSYRVTRFKFQKYVGQNLHANTEGFAETFTIIIIIIMHA